MSRTWMEFWTFWLQLGPVPLVVAIWGSEPVGERSPFLNFSLLFCHSEKSYSHLHQRFWFICLEIKPCNFFFSESLSSNVIYSQDWCSIWINARRNFTFLLVSVTDKRKGIVFVCVFVVLMDLIFCAALFS